MINWRKAHTQSGGIGKRATNEDQQQTQAQERGD